MIITVQDKDGLDIDGYYVRGGIDPTKLSGPKCGHNYVRADGKPWKEAGYYRRTDPDTGVVSVRLCVITEGGSDPAHDEVQAYYKANL